MGFRQPECCNASEHALIRDAHSSKCPDGSQAGGQFGEYFVATFAVSCDDLLCAEDERCVDLGGLAKCCRRGSTKSKEGKEKKGAGR